MTPDHSEPKFSYPTLLSP